MPAKNKWFGAGTIILENNFSLAWRTLDASGWGVPQRRRRIFLVADFGGTSASKILFEQSGLSRDIESCESQREGTSENAKNSIGNSSKSIEVMPFDVSHIIVQQKKNLMFGEPSTTLQANAEAPSIVIKEVLPFDTTQITNPDSHSNPQYGSACHTLAVNAHTPKIAVKEKIYCTASGQANAPTYENLSPTLTSAAGTSGNNQPYIFDMTHPADVIRKCGEICPTLKRRMGTGGNQIPLIINEKTQSMNVMENQTGALLHTDYKGPQCIYTLDRSSFNQGVNAKYDFKIIDDNVSSTLVAKGPSAVSVPNENHYIRKLTPKECERLQGYRDFWTIVDPKEKFTDEEFEFWKNVYVEHKKIFGKIIPNKRILTKQKLLNWYNKLSSDSARYKALGNSIAVPCVDFIMRKIVEIKGEGE